LDKIKRIKELTELLNTYRDAYYNGSKSLVSDYNYDNLYDELQILENETGFILNNSPTQSVGYEVKSKLRKVKHSHPMLSLDKTKSVDDIRSLLNGRVGIAMLKMDGLTTGVSYSDGELVSAETRGNGVVGEDVLHNARTIKNLPQQITVSDLLVDGEAIITRSDFEKINATIMNEDDKYKNPRNLASGSIRQLDSKVAAKRNLRFIAWKCVNGINDNSFLKRLNKMQELGFEVVPHRTVPPNATKEELEQIIEELQFEAEDKGFPIDGIVFGFDDVAYGESLGATGHHLRSQIAFKFYDEEVVTVLRNIEWSCGKSGNLTPVAIFAPVDLDGTEVSRASLHNVSICKGLQLGIGDKIVVYKANMIIPQIRDNLTKSNTFVIPQKCPVCGASTIIRKDNDTEVLACINDACPGKLLGRVSHFVSKKGMDIEGLSEATLEKFISLGWIKCLFDVYNLSCHYEELWNMEGFGVKSVEKLAKSIENSKNVELRNFISALSIPGIGSSQSKELAKKFKTWDAFQTAGFGNYNFAELEGFGSVINHNIHHWFDTMWNYDRIGKMVKNVRFQAVDTDNNARDNVLAGKAFVITGSMEHFKNRKEIQEIIESKGGKVTGSVTAKTNYLINNDTTSGSSKNKKAKELGIPIISEQEFIVMVGDK
jgi:DNA ligase (NAD+)